MLLLSRVIGEEVVGADGLAVGRLADLTTRIDGDGGRELVDRMVIKRRHAAPLVLDFATVARLYPGGVSLCIPSGEVARFEVRSVSDTLGGDEILLARDVLDTQVVDIVGQRLARVADVVLALAAGVQLEIVGVEVGFGGVMRRLGLGGLIPRSTEDIVEWSDLHLASDRGHAVQLSAPRAAVHRLDSRSLAILVTRVDVDAASEILAARDPAVAADALRSASPEVSERMLRALPKRIVDRILAAMPTGHAGRWRARLARRPALGGRRFLRSRVWPRRPHLARGPRA